MPDNETEKQPKPSTDEIAGAGNDIYKYFLGKVQTNPDYILAKESKGKGLKLYGEMLDKDPHLFSVVQTRKLGVLSKPWEIVPGSDEQRDQDIAEFVRENIYNIEYFYSDLAELLDAVGKGFAVSETMWKLAGGAVLIKELKSRDPRRFVFDLDNRPRLKTRGNMLDGEELPDRKFLVHTFAPEYENPYGEGVLKKCYWYWWFKNHGIKFWMMFAEKFGTPTTVGKYPPGTEKTKQDEFLKILEKIQTETALVIPENLIIELLEQQRKSSTDTYQVLMSYMDSQMSQAVLGQTLTSGEGKHGTQALGTVHQGVRQDYIEADCISLMPVVNQLIRWLVDYNFSNPVYYPTFVIHYEEPSDLRALGYLFRVLFKDLNLPVSKAFLYDTFGISIPADDDELLEPFAVPGFGGPGEAGGGGEFSERARRKYGATMRHHFPAFSEDDAEQERYLRDTDELAEAALERAAGVYGDLTAKVMKSLSKKKDEDPVTADMLEQISKIKLDPKPLAQLLRDTLLVADLMAWNHFYEEHSDVLAEIGKFGDREKRGHDEASFPRFSSVSYEPMPPRLAIEFFKKLIPMSAAEIKALSAKLESYGFKIAGIENGRILNMIHAALLDALEAGITIGEFRKRVNALFDTNGISRLSNHHIENVFRTNLHTAYSAGNWQVLHDPDVEGYFPYFMYLTAGDESVRVSHAAMHRFTARRDDPVWDTWWPPNGYRCRCRVRAVSKYEAEKKKVEPTPFPGFRPDEGFEGTPMEQLGLAA